MCTDKDKTGLEKPGLTGRGYLVLLELAVGHFVGPDAKGLSSREAGDVYAKRHAAAKPLLDLIE